MGRTNGPNNGRSVIMYTNERILRVTKYTEYPINTVQFVKSSTQDVDLRRRFEIPHILVVILLKEEVALTDPPPPLLVGGVLNRWLSNSIPSVPLAAVDIVFELRKNKNQENKASIIDGDCYLVYFLFCS